MNNSVFALDIAKFANKAKGNADKVVRKVVLDIGSRVVERSPVGDASHWKRPPPPGYVGGRFRANWQHGVGEMPKTVFDTVDDVSNERIAASLNGGDAFAVHYIVNNLPYSIALENGHSQQATPGGIVGLTVAEFGNIVRDAVKEVNP
jgi:hypothetical protein